ncbi:hypothetical protein MN608_04570 [Microdochium nivale]|nr:hypothetical protein MN608_04570 [Microdochium nivale]
MNAAGGIWAPAAMRVVRIAASRAGKVLRAKLVRPVQTALEPALARASPPRRQPIHPVAFLRQQKSHGFRSRAAAAAARFFSTVRAGPRLDNSKFLKSKVGQAVSQFPGRTPFANALRPNLTGGALPRSAGGYGLGSGGVGGARFFSHGPTSQAQVFQNVSQAVRAFWISGQKAQFDGVNSRGEARFRAVSAIQDETMRKLSACSYSSATRQAPGSNLDFPLNPTVTALGPLSAAFPSRPPPPPPSSTTPASTPRVSSTCSRATLPAPSRTSPRPSPTCKGFRPLAIYPSSSKRAAMSSACGSPVWMPTQSRLCVPTSASRAASLPRTRTLTSPRACPWRLSSPLRRP